ncbi:hypothetical protein M378DRAFT_155674 [Amanita muscaria Koide BX008]|uniref:Zn(2)-C6 fungal-type domain-containing protein n=1 Tax=Amanita muscaria (strain Koide BX008) TaxID=946122 RepID=A0A0C2XNK3_AMAMK|nr:hypothetical protein M378DRAFT_155674 [Amanita muscaria Koide BX008]
MPKSSSNNPSRPALRRNQACRSCRKRKLKCDAARPHCSTCVKQWQALISVPAPIGYAHPPEPQCSYDPVEGLTLAPDTDPVERIRDLEEEISRLKQKLYERQNTRSLSPAAGLGRRNSAQSQTATPPASSPGHSTELSTTALPRVSLGPIDVVGPESRGVNFDSVSGSPDIQSGSNAQLSQLLFSGWEPDLPDPNTLEHYVDVFFLRDSCGSRILHRPTFISSLKLHPKDPGFPHPAILHAICASTSRWLPQHVIELPDGSRCDRFADFHAGKTRQYIDRTMASGEDILAVLQACIILSWYFYQEGRWVEVWIFAAFQTRVAIPLRLNYPGTFSTFGQNSPGAYLAPPNDLRDVESRRRTWWMAILFDRIASVGGWIHAVDERDIGTEFPLRNKDFESERPMLDNPQTLANHDVLIHHLPQYIDPFLLLIKAIMLFGRVTDFNVRGSLRGSTPSSKNQNPFFLDGFEGLDKMVARDFLENLPLMYKNHAGVTDSIGNRIFDTDLYMVHIIPHAATIALHNEYINFTDSQCISAARCTHAARSILAAYYTLSASSMDITRLHPFVAICWYLAAVVLVQLCKYFIEIGDPERESVVWGEINVLRFAMRTYGHRSPIGTRQERLLQRLLSEIVQMTTQKQPLEVGVPLYHFSHSTLFRTDETSPTTSDDCSPIPLPRNTQYQDQSMAQSHANTIPANAEPSHPISWGIDSSCGQSNVHNSIATFLT